jgi:hypothetical protein
MRETTKERERRRSGEKRATEGSGEVWNWSNTQNRALFVLIKSDSNLCAR